MMYVMTVFINDLLNDLFYVMLCMHEPSAVTVSLCPMRAPGL